MVHPGYGRASRVPVRWLRDPKTHPAPAQPLVSGSLGKSPSSLSLSRAVPVVLLRVGQDEKVDTDEQWLS